MKTVKKVLTLLLILTIISQIFIPSNVKAQSTIRTYDSNSLYDEVAKNAVLDNKRSEYVDSDTGIDFTQGASSTNGQGVYTIASTKDDLYPIHYYRGNIDNNNVLFGGFCWQIVRTTETGGVKLIYNGDSVDGKCENMKLNWDLKTSSYQKGSYMYGIDIDNVIISNDVLYSIWYELADDSYEDIYYDSGYSIPGNDFYYSEEVEYSEETNEYTLKNAKQHNRDESTEEIKGVTPLYFCESGTESCSEVKLILWDWDTYYDSEYLVLSNGITYEDIKKKNLIFANDVEYKDGHYELKNIINIPLMSINTEDNIKDVLDGHRYFCDDFTESCESINYIIDYYYEDSKEEYEFYYLKIIGGFKADNIYDEFKNSSNKNDSEIKKVIDKWYSENLTDNEEYLEDTVWCNDRSIIANVFNKDLKLTDFDFMNYIKLSNICLSKNDRFTVSNKNGNGKLTYPVATITDKEMAYAGSPSKYVNESEIESIWKPGPVNYLSNYTYYDSDFLTMTPYGFGEIFFGVDTAGYLSYPSGLCEEPLEPSSIKTIATDKPCFRYSLVRPMVSLKHSMVVSSGDGSPTNPYEVVEGNTVEYVIDGDMPNGFIPPEVGSYLKGSKVKMNGLKAGDIVNGYRFLGWHTEDVEVEGDTFDMPENKVVFVGKFEKIVDSPLTYDSISKYLTTGIIGVAGLVGLVLLKKKI